MVAVLYCYHSNGNKLLNLEDTANCQNNTLRDLNMPLLELSWFVFRIKLYSIAFFPNNPC